MTLPASLLYGFRLRCLEEQLGVRSVHVYRRGSGQIGHDFVEQRPQNLYSAAKTVTALAIGLLTAEAGLDLDAALLDFFPEKKDLAAAGVEKITLRQALHMSTGKSGAFFQEEAFHTKRDWLDVYLSEAPRYRPGSRFHYNNPTTYALGRVVQQLSGQTLLDYLLPRLFEPLGIERPLWHTCPQGHTRAYSDLYLTPNDFARLGRLLLDQGIWEEKQLLPASYVQAMSRDVVATRQFEEEETRAGYGYQCWLGTVAESFRADGLYGQFALVSPRHESVVTVTAHNVHTPYRILTAIKEEILALLGVKEESYG